MTSDKKIEWKDTLNLPKTDFPMKAQLNQREPLILKKWQDLDIYKRILASRQGKSEFILHDGPPYANGHIHLGTALNKILKDFVVKSRTMQDLYAPYVPGWDCHGLPIEIQVDRNLGEKKDSMDIISIREECRKFAERFIDIQREEFKRLGVFGNWEDPYTTLNPGYESTIVDCFKSFVKTNNVYRRKRPVYWCVSCKTALAEAEVEYANHTSPSIYVKFKLKDLPPFLSKFQDRDIFVLIWTTTPWTIPANLAIALHPEYDYALFEAKGELFIAATRLIPVLSDILNTNYKILHNFKGTELRGYNTVHPLYDRNSVLITAEYVTLDTGTGCVHTAPGHGEEDYFSGLEYKLDIYSPVNDAGLFDSTTGKYEGKQVFETNEEIVVDLNQAHRLIHEEKIEHSYPHCWRCKNPVIFRATEQWFISMDTAQLRQRALKKIKETKWLPPWGEDRIYSMIDKRPDWCISRQRDWGVPIPVFYCKSCQEPVLNVEVIDQVQKIFAQEGSNSWYIRDAKELMPLGYRCQSCGDTHFEKGMDIIDVWFESGASWGTLEKNPGHRFPSDLYLEGGDQYRGWFHSSLLVAVSARNNAPYKTVISHGWVLDERGRAMSKSMGNVIEPQKIIDDKGAEILRLWVAMVNYKEDVKLGQELLQRLTESYRKIRNTWRFMLGVIADFRPDPDMAADKDLRETDLYILFRLQQVKQRIIQAYQEYEYHVIYHEITNFFIIDLSAFYLSFQKDNLYCNVLGSTKRRATQTVIFKVLRESLLLMAPILSFTVEEAWEYVPAFKGKNESVHLENFPVLENQYATMIDQPKWDQIIKIKDRVFKEIEEARGTQKIIGDSLEAIVTMNLNTESHELVSQNLELFKEILGVAELVVKESEEEGIKVDKSSGKKCPRCWNRYREVTESELCPRCQSVVKELNIEAVK